MRWLRKYCFEAERSWHRNSIQFCYLNNNEQNMRPRVTDSETANLIASYIYWSIESSFSEESDPDPVKIRPDPNLWYVENFPKKFPFCSHDNNGHFIITNMGLKDLHLHTFSIFFVILNSKIHISTTWVIVMYYSLFKAPVSLLPYWNLIKE